MAPAIKIRNGSIKLKSPFWSQNWFLLKFKFTYLFRVGFNLKYENNSELSRFFLIFFIDFF